MGLFMNYELFKSLSEDEKKTFIDSLEDKDKKISDLEAERDSFKSENDLLKEANTKSTEELKATKELNFSLARKLNVESKETPEESLYNFIKGEKA